VLNGKATRLGPAELKGPRPAPVRLAVRPSVTSDHSRRLAVWVYWWRCLQTSRPCERADIQLFRHPERVV